jgi:DNA primase small subunit
MEERTRAYLRGRFRDHYRRHPPELPPAANAREWGFIPWTAGPGTTMVRHRSLLDVGDLGSFLQRKRPRHVYFSAGRYEDPGASGMDAKGWRETDLVFDLDADHLPRADPESDSYAEMLATCKAALQRLLTFVEDDFGFEDVTVVFSGGRGYHVHVRDESVRALGREARREIVEYVRPGSLSLDDVATNRVAAGAIGRETPADSPRLDTSGGWSKRVHDRLLSLVDEVLAADEERAHELLQAYDGIGAGSSEKLLSVFADRYDEIAAGNVDVHGRLKHLADLVAAETVERDAAPIDEPVTTDINRLIRLPGSLHGGSGLAVTPIDRDELDAFDPLVDAVPETFRGRDITVDVTEGGAVELDGDSFTLQEGAQSVPEHLGAFLMCRDRAEKERE